MEIRPSYPNKFESKDVMQYVTSISRQEVQNLSRLEKEKPWIVLPKELYNATEQMCLAQRETRGVFLVPRQSEAMSKGRIAVEAMISIGYGSSVQVYPDEAKFNAMNKLLQEYRDHIMPIDFHTHTVATGSAFSNTFSSQDTESIANNVNRHQGYMHVLFTPTNILTFGKGKPEFAVAEFAGINPVHKQEFWQQKFNEYLRQ